MATFFKVLRFIGKYRFLLVLSVILAAVTVILQLYVPVLFGYAIDEVVAAHEVDFTRMGFYLSRILVMIVFSGIATWIMSVKMCIRDRDYTVLFCRSFCLLYFPLQDSLSSELMRHLLPL